MLQSFAQRVFHGWHLMRWLRLGMGLLILQQAIVMMDAVLALLAGTLLFMALSNTGCCGVNGCALPMTGTKKIDDEPLHGIEEIK